MRPSVPLLVWGALEPTHIRRSDVYPRAADDAAAPP